MPQRNYGAYPKLARNILHSCKMFRYQVQDYHEQSLPTPKKNARLYNRTAKRKIWWFQSNIYTKKVSSRAGLCQIHV